MWFLRICEQTLCYIITIVSHIRSARTSQGQNFKWFDCFHMSWMWNWTNCAHYTKQLWCDRTLQNPHKSTQYATQREWMWWANRIYKGSISGWKVLYFFSYRKFCEDSFLDLMIVIDVFLFVFVTFACKHEISRMEIWPEFLLVCLSLLLVQYNTA